MSSIKNYRRITEPCVPNRSDNNCGRFISARSMFRLEYFLIYSNSTCTISSWLKWESSGIGSISWLHNRDRYLDMAYEFMGQICSSYICSDSIFLSLFFSKINLRISCLFFIEKSAFFLWKLAPFFSGSIKQIYNDYEGYKAASIY